jgi:hypothetical protein
MKSRCTIVAALGQFQRDISRLAGQSSEVSSVGDSAKYGCSPFAGLHPREQSSTHPHGKHGLLSMHWYIGSRCSGPSRFRQQQQSIACHKLMSPDRGFLKSAVEETITTGSTSRCVLHSRPEMPWTTRTWREVYEMQTRSCETRCTRSDDGQKQD